MIKVVEYFNSWPKFKGLARNSYYTFTDATIALGQLRFFSYLAIFAEPFSDWVQPDYLLNSMIPYLFSESKSIVKTLSFVVKAEIIE